MNLQKPIRVGIDGRVLMHYEMRGFARYTVELFRAMKQIAGSKVELLSFSEAPIAPQFAEALEITPVVFGARREVLWEQVELPKQLRAAAVDIFHATANRGLPYRKVCKYVLTCHDVIDRLPEYTRGEHWRARWRKGYADFAARHSADKYITVSEFSKRDICRFHGIAPDRVQVIYNAAGPAFHARVSEDEVSRIRRKYALPARYFLFLGGFDSRKNVATSSGCLRAAAGGRSATGACGRA